MLWLVKAILELVINFYSVQVSRPIKCASITGCHKQIVITKCVNMSVHFIFHATSYLYVKTETPALIDKLRH